MAGRRHARGLGAAGFNMLEVILVIVILVLAMLPILSTFFSSHQDTRFTMEEVQATNLATELVEALQALSFAQLRAFPETEFTMDAAGNLVSNPPGVDPFEIAISQGNLPSLSTKKISSQFKVFLEVDSFPDSGVVLTGATLAKIAVRISWGARNKETRLVTFKGR